MYYVFALVASFTPMLWLCRELVRFGALVDYVEHASRNGGLLPRGISSTDDDWIGVQRTQCCVFLASHGGGIGVAFGAYGFEEHTMLSWPDFAKYAAPHTCINPDTH